MFEIVFLGALGIVPIVIPFLLKEHYKNKFFCLILFLSGLSIFFSSFLFVLTQFFLFPIIILIAITLPLGLILGSLGYFLVYERELYIYRVEQFILKDKIPNEEFKKFKKNCKEYIGKNKKLAETHKDLKFFRPYSGAIIAIKNRRIFGEDDSVFADGIDLLVNYFKESKHCPLKIFICKTPDEAKNVINDPLVEKIWIFGHGTIYGLSFGTNGFLPYKNLKDAPKKDFIGQFHCNGHSDRCLSLADLILKQDGKKYAKAGYRFSLQNRLAIQKGNEKDWNCEN